jgi:alpha-ribazole phosphatase
MTTTITLIRHGQIKGEPALYGHTDVALSEQGHTSLYNVIECIHTLAPINKFISSPLKRCADVAQVFAQQYELDLQLIPEFKEMHFGDWDGVAFDQLGDEWKNLEAFYASPFLIHPPNGETLEIFANRVIDAWHDLTKQVINSHCVLICHAGVIRIIIAHILRMDWKNANLFTQLHIDYASHTRIEIGNFENAVPVVKWIGAR